MLRALRTYSLSASQSSIDEGRNEAAGVIALSLRSGVSLASHAQQRPARADRLAGVGLASAYANRVEVLRLGLRDLGYVRARTLPIVFRWAEKFNHWPLSAIELARIMSDGSCDVSTEVEPPTRPKHSYRVCTPSRSLQPRDGPPSAARWNQRVTMLSRARRQGTGDMK